jgi:hypothetical protein
MRDVLEYLQAYRIYVSANLGWRAVLRMAAVWLAGMCVPLACRVLMPLPLWAAGIWMIIWALLGYVFAPYGMWKHQRARNPEAALPDRR